MLKTNAPISNEDWGRIHAKAWLDPVFKLKLETDPTGALKDFAREHGLSWTQLVAVCERPEGVSDKELLEIVGGQTTYAHAVIACC